MADYLASIFGTEKDKYVLMFVSADNIYTNAPYVRIIAYVVENGG